MATTIREGTIVERTNLMRSENGVARLRLRLRIEDISLDDGGGFIIDCEALGNVAERLDQYSEEDTVSLAVESIMDRATKNDPYPKELSYVLKVAPDGVSYQAAIDDIIEDLVYKDVPIDYGREGTISDHEPTSRHGNTLDPIQDNYQDVARSNE